MSTRAKTQPLTPSDLSALGDVLEFMRLLWGVDHGLQTASKRMESELGVTGPQRLVIRIVGRFPGISAGQLARVLSVHPSTLTGILKRLEARDLIVKKSDPQDARRVLLHPTAKGKDMEPIVEITTEAAVTRALARLQADDVAACRRVLETLIDELGGSEQDGE